MKSYFQSLFRILASIFHFFFPEETKKQRGTAYERLMSASICDTMEFAVKNSRNYRDSCKEETEQTMIQQSEQIYYHAPVIPDIKKQFRMWSANMKEYDALRKRLLNSV